MKKIIILFTAIIVLALGACGSKEEKKESDEKTVLKVASLIPPMTEILEQTKPLLAKENIDLEIVVLSDNVQPNTALANKEVDANFFQHKPFMEEYNKANGSKLVALEQIYFPNFGIYSKKYKSWAALPTGATIAIANDLSNIDRTLQLLKANKAITLKEKTDTYYTIKDVVDNKKNLKFKEVDLLMLARMYDEADAVVMYPAYAAPLGLTPKKDAIMTEGAGNEYALQLVAREDNKDSDAIKKLKKAMTSEKVRQFLEEKYDETATPAF
ncbi:MetQ/NlpA family ABC transporter substrate-binding protein [Kurthia sibirica]|uniref:Lipoprotein n=1 Tax=Kurthia sibirica TaxID=202750 RepID=A0A2U3APL4_9BACL|nr:MetQ/NlpA family ABC transporter substrate-binding protein [Kurthia sibirica]PWI26482.1 ABC transporter substrate-binding protein [Kurthia sibirica]GEK33051.1 TonB-dependent receptor [Kurthia sibirica]